MALDHFRLLAMAALADGKLSDEEKPVLLQAAAHFGITREQAGALVLELTNNKPVTARLPKEPTDRGKLFEAMIEVVAADGNIDPRELALFERIAPRFGLTADQAGAILQAVREVLDAHAKRSLD